MLYVIKLSTKDGTPVGFFERGKAVPLRQATVYDSPSSANASARGNASRSWAITIQPLRIARRDTLARTSGSRPQ